MKTEIHENYFSDYDNKRLKAWEFKNENFVKDHTIKGVVMFSNGEKDFVKNMEKQFNDPGIPKWTLENVKSISMFKSSIPGEVLGRSRKYSYMGVWRKGTGEIFMAHQTRAAKKKIYTMSGKSTGGNLFGTTGDHEVAHATFDAVEQKTRFSKPDEPLKKAFDNFNSAVSSAYDTEGFSIHPYTDSYKHDYLGRLNTEAHSKLREFEKTGEMDEYLSYARDDPAGNVRRTLVERYKTLRKEMYNVKS